MKSLVSKQGKKGAWSSFLKEFWIIFKNKDFSLKFFEKGNILMRFYAFEFFLI